MVEKSLNDLLEREKSVRKEKDHLRGEIQKLCLQVEQLEARGESTVGQLERLNRRLGESEQSYLEACAKLTASQSALRVQEEASQRYVPERAELKRSIDRLERALHKTESEIAGTERESDGCQSLSLHDLSPFGPRQLQEENSRLRDCKERLETTLESREREHHQRLKGLQEQVSLLKSRLSVDRCHRRRYVSDTGRVSRRLWRLRSELGLSLRALSLDPHLSTLDVEASRLQLSLRRSREGRASESPMKSPLTQ